MRIFHNCKVIYQQHHSNSEMNPLWGLKPHNATLGVLFMSGLACKISEAYIYDPQDVYSSWFMHVMVGVVCLLITLLVVLNNEPQVKQYALRSRHLRND